MAFTIETIKAYGGTGDDIVIQAELDAFEDTYTCLTSSYSEAVADSIGNMYLAGSLQSQSGYAQVTQEKAASGASTSFKQDKYGADSEYDNALLASAYRKDVNGCLPIDDSQFSFGSAGKKFEADNPS